ncbi:hypothetical protein TrCOL_g817 [Triparma columacea]|uniref:RGS domain-containing protein n=1 Tax=Triparma columacea TaxID=722753 RepID=A0A9W7GAB7_9STRA|nr:hypothetical protein TrCOL_g817 [Triparma columacea]
MMYIGILMSSIVSYVEAFGWETMPCFVHMFATVLFPPFFLAPLSVGAFCHFKESRIHAKMAKHANDINLTNRTTRDKEMFTKLVNDLKTERKNLRGFNVKAIILFLVIYGGMFTWIIFSSVLSRDFASMMKPLDSHHGDRSCTDVILSITQDETDDPRNIVAYFGMILYMSSLIFISLICYYTKRRGLTDDYGITKEYKYVCALGYFTLFIYTGIYYWHVWFPERPVRFFEKEVVDPIIVFVISLTIVYGILVLWPALRTYKQGDAAAMGRVSVDSTDMIEVLNSNLYYLFIEHLKSEFSVENCLFWKKVQQFKIDYGGLDDEGTGVGNSLRGKRSNSAGAGLLGMSTRHLGPGGHNPIVGSDFAPGGADDTAREIYDMFIKDGAPMEVNISSEIRGKIEKEIEGKRDAVGPCVECGEQRESGVQLGMEAEEGGIDLGVFDEAQNEVFKLMESDSLPRFKQGKLFKNYVEALSPKKHLLGRHIGMEHGGAKEQQKDGLGYVGDNQL